MAHVFFISTVNGRSKKNTEKKPIMSCASSGHINKTWAIYFWAFDIYGLFPENMNSIQCVHRYLIKQD